MNKILWLLIGTHLTLGFGLNRENDRGRVLQQSRELDVQAQILSQSWDPASVSRAADLYLRAAKELHDAKNLEESTNYLLKAGELMLWENKRLESETILKKVIVTKKTLNDADREAEALYLLTLLSLKKNDLTSATHYRDRALSLSEHTKSHRASGFAFLASGELEYQRRDIPRMLDAQEKAFHFFKDVGDLQYQAESLRNLAYAYVMNNQQRMGVDTAKLSVDLARRSNNRRTIAFTLTAYGNANQRIGEWKLAKEAFDEAEKLFPEGLDPGEKAILFTKIGAYYESLDDLANAQKYFREAQVLYEVSGNLTGSSELLTVVGQVLLRTGKPEEALEYFKKGLDLSRSLNDPWSLCLAEERVGDAYSQNGNITLAKRSYLEALSLAEASKSVRYRIASIEKRIGNLEEATNNLDRAMERYKKALLVSSAVEDKDTMSEVFYCIARVYAAEGRLTTGLEKVAEALRITESLNIQTANSQLKASYFSGVFDRYELYIELLMRLERENPNQGFVLKALQASEQARARIMRENMRLADTDFARDAPRELVEREKELTEQLNIKRSQLTELLSSDPLSKEVEKSEIEAHRVETELENVKADLKRTSPIFATISDSTPMDMLGFQRDVLSENSLFLEFSFGKNESYLWVVGKKDIDHYVLPPKSELEQKIVKVLEYLRSNERRKDESTQSYDARLEESERNYPAAAADLSRTLLGPAADKIAGKRLIIAPDGMLAYLPFSVLPFPNSENPQPLIATNEIVYVASASVLSLVKTLGEKERSLPPEDLLVFADPVFAADDERLKGGGGDQSVFSVSLGMLRSANSIKDLGRLPASGEEADTVASFVPAFKIYRGFEANRENVLSGNLKNYRIIHFATHGILNEEHPELSGILLSLYDSKGIPNEGFVRPQDIYGLDLNADLVVLSACNSGIGKEVRGEGMMNLTNAFIQAGARSVVSSLWKVDDNATQELMHRFYEALSGGGVTVPQALRQAQLDMMRDPRYRAPFYWAAFTAQGGLDVKVGLSSNRNLSIVIGVAGIFVIGVFLMIGRRIRSRYSTAK